MTWKERAFKVVIGVSAAVASYFLLGVFDVIILVPVVFFSGISVLICVFTSICPNLPDPESIVLVVTLIISGLVGAFVHDLVRVPGLFRKTK